MDFKNSIDCSQILKSAIHENSVRGFDIRNIEKGSEKEKIKNIAVQFEQIMIETLLKSADYNKSESKDSLMSFGVLKDFRTMLMAQHISNNGGLGYQKIIEEQILAKQKPAAYDPEFRNFKLSPPQQCEPVKGRISSKFGLREDPINSKVTFHKGIDIAVPENSEVKSFMAGEVIFSGWKRGYGNTVEIKHADGYFSRYAHNSALECKAGDKIAAGEIISKSGSTGRSTGPHLHFEIHRNGKPVDPEKILPKISKV